MIVAPLAAMVCTLCADTDIDTAIDTTRMTIRARSKRFKGYLSHTLVLTQLGFQTVRYPLNFHGENGSSVSAKGELRLGGENAGEKFYEFLTVRAAKELC